MLPSVLLFEFKQRTDGEFQNKFQKILIFL